MRTVLRVRMPPVAYVYVQTHTAKQPAAPAVAGGACSVGMVGDVMGDQYFCRSCCIRETDSTHGQRLYITCTRRRADPDGSSWEGSPCEPLSMAMLALDVQVHCSFAHCQ
jgi:hypothetical protein